LRATGFYEFPCPLKASLTVSHQYCDSPSHYSYLYAATLNPKIIIVSQYRLYLNLFNAADIDQVKLFLRKGDLEEQITSPFLCITSAIWNLYLQVFLPQVEAASGEMAYQNSSPENGSPFEMMNQQIEAAAEKKGSIK
jgi:hypothetical protein